MYIPSLGIKLHLTPEKRIFLKEFFNETCEFFETQDMLNSNNIGVYADTYMEYLMNSKYKEDEDLKLFYYELKASQLREKMIENKKIKLSPREMMMRKSIPASSNNSIINKWRSESSIVRTASKTDITVLDSRLDPILKQNAEERRLIMEATHNNFVGGK